MVDAPLKPDTYGSTLLASEATAAYIADLMLKHPVVQVRLRSHKDANSWIMKFTLHSQSTDVNAMSTGVISLTSNASHGINYFEFGIVNISRWQRVGSGTAVSLDGSSGLEGEDRGQMSKFLTMLSRALKESKHKPVVTAADPSGRIKLRLRAAE